MLAEKALELIRELQRTTDGTLPPFNVNMYYFNKLCVRNYFQKHAVFAT